MKGPITMSLEIPTAPGERFLSYKIYPLFYFGKHAYIFRVGRGGRILCWNDFKRGEFFMKREVSRGSEILLWVNLLGFLYKIPLYVLFFLYRFKFSLVDVKGNCPG
jgi:hypothetical protein